MSILYTIGFTKKSAKKFFELLIQNKIELVADVRLHNSSQLAGFTKKDDLKYFLSLVHIQYEHWIDFAPSEEIRNNYRSTHNWKIYRKNYTRLIEERKIIDRLDKNKMFKTRIALLCAEHDHNECHRTIAAEMIKNKFPAITIRHL